MIKIDKRNFLDAKKKKNVLIRFLYIYQPVSISYISKEVLLFAQSLVVHVQLDAQVGNVLIKSLLVGR